MFLLESMDHPGTTGFGQKDRSTGERARLGHGKEGEASGEGMGLGDRNRCSTGLEWAKPLGMERQ